MKIVTLPALKYLMPQVNQSELSNNQERKLKKIIQMFNKYKFVNQTHVNYFKCEFLLIY